MKPFRGGAGGCGLRNRLRVDVALREDGVERIVEIGDGQVSDLVGWSPERFAEMWRALPASYA